MYTMYTHIMNIHSNAVWLEDGFRIPLQLEHVGRICSSKNPESKFSGTSLCRGESPDRSALARVEPPSSQILTR